MKRKAYLMILVLNILVLMAGCGKKEEMTQEEISTETITEEETEEVLVSGKGQDMAIEEEEPMPEASVTDAEDDPNTIYPLNNGFAFDPTYKHVDIYRGEFDRFKIASDVLELLHSNDIYDTCVEIEFLEYRPEYYSYLMTIRFENSPEIKAEYFVYANDTSIYLYEEDVEWHSPED